MSNVKVGDVVAWEKVPKRALFRYHECYEMRRDDEHHVLGYLVSGSEFSLDLEPGQWGFEAAFNKGEVTIVAVDVPVDLTIDGLRRLAEVFEVREALRHLFGLTVSPSNPVLQSAIMALVNFGRAHGLQTLAELLHTAGWRPGDSAERAALLLEEVRDAG